MHFHLFQSCPTDQGGFFAHLTKLELNIKQTKLAAECGEKEKGPEMNPTSLLHLPKTIPGKCMAQSQP